MSMPICEPVLLTGAGFTHNFGGFLARDMWSWIFNSQKVQSRPALADLLKDDFDYESVYYEVQFGEYEDEDRMSLHAAVKGAYELLDSVIRDFSMSPGSPYAVNIYGINKFLEGFAGERNSRGYVFTLNQDLFAERWYARNKSLVTPGMKSLHFSPTQRRPLNRDDFFPVPGPDQMDKIRSEDKQTSAPPRLHYVKLHGSMNWHTQDGRDVMIIGRKKLDRIRSEPLLDWYFETFERVLSLPDRRLLVIGYGFGDPHVNEVIAKAALHCGLELYVVSPNAPEDFKNMLLQREHGKTLWERLARYFPCELRAIYPADQSRPVLSDEINRVIFHRIIR